jgi:hypothetical protein
MASPSVLEGTPRKNSQSPRKKGAECEVGGFRNQQGPAQTGVGQYKVVIRLEQHQLMLHAVFTLAERIDPAPYCRYPLTNIEVELLDEGRVDRPATRRQDLLDGQLRAEHHMVRDPDDAPHRYDFTTWA